MLSRGSCLLRCKLPSLSRPSSRSIRIRRILRSKVHQVRPSGLDRPRTHSSNVVRTPQQYDDYVSLPDNDRPTLRSSKHLGTASPNGERLGDTHTQTMSESGDFHSVTLPTSQRGTRTSGSRGSATVQSTQAASRQPRTSVRARQPNIAVLIDGDNVSAKVMPELLNHVASYGDASLLRVYGDWSDPNRRGWLSYSQNHWISPVQSFARTKNAIDTAMIIDAMDLMHTGRYSAFCLVSGDGDFTSLASRIRQQGLSVYGFGFKKHTSPALIAACNHFTFLQTPATREQREEQSIQLYQMPAGSAPLQAVRTFDESTLDLITKAVKEARTSGDEWAEMAVITQRLMVLCPGFNPVKYGYRTVHHFLRATDLVDLALRKGSLGDQFTVLVARLKAIDQFRSSETRQPSGTITSPAPVKSSAGTFLPQQPYVGFREPFEPPVREAIVEAVRRSQVLEDGWVPREVVIETLKRLRPDMDPRFLRSYGYGNLTQFLTSSGFAEVEFRHCQQSKGVAAFVRLKEVECVDSANSGDAAGDREVATGRDLADTAQISEPTALVQSMDEIPIGELPTTGASKPLDDQARELIIATLRGGLRSWRRLDYTSQALRRIKPGLATEFGYPDVPSLLRASGLVKKKRHRGRTVVSLIDSEVRKVYDVRVNGSSETNGEDLNTPDPWTQNINPVEEGPYDWISSPGASEPIAPGNEVPHDGTAAWSSQAQGLPTLEQSNDAEQIGEETEIFQTTDIEQNDENTEADAWDNEEKDFDLMDENESIAAEKLRVNTEQPGPEIHATIMTAEDRTRPIDTEQDMQDWLRSTLPDYGNAEKDVVLAAGHDTKTATQVVGSTEQGMTASENNAEADEDSAFDSVADQTMPPIQRIATRTIRRFQPRREDPAQTSV